MLSGQPLWDSNETSIRTPNYSMEPLYLEFHKPLMIFTATVIGAAAVIGTLGNILIVMALCLVKPLRTCGNIFVLNLALADLVVTCFVDPFNVVGAVAGRKVLLGDGMLCEWVANFCAPACMSSMWNMCAISLNRYVLICHPHLYPKIFTFPSTIGCCVVIWIMAHMFHLPNHLGWGVNKFNGEYYLCSFDILLHSYAVFYVVTGILIPLIGVLFGYWRIFMKVRSVKALLRARHVSLTTQTLKNPALAHPGDHSQDCADGTTIKMKRPWNPGFTQDDVKLAKTLFAAFLVFLICWLPFTVFVMANEPPEIPRWLYVVAIIMAHGNSAVNPILYGWTNDNFRDGYRKVLRLRKKSVTPFTTGTGVVRLVTVGRSSLHTTSTYQLKH